MRYLRHTAPSSEGVWIFTFPALVASTDVNIYDPDGTLSDHLRTISPHNEAHGLLPGYTPDSQTACIQAKISAQPPTAAPCANRLIYYSLDDLGGQPFPTTTPAFTIENADGTWSFTGTSGNTFAVPVPSTLSLFATSLVGLGLLGWRRKRKAQAV